MPTPGLAMPPFRRKGSRTSARRKFDAGPGCPFACSFARFNCKVVIAPPLARRCRKIPKMSRRFFIVFDHATSSQNKMGSDSGEINYLRQRKNSKSALSFKLIRSATNCRILSKNRNSPVSKEFISDWKTSIPIV